MGGIAAPFAGPERAVFALGALLASLGWFAGFACAVARLSARFVTGSFWRLVDLIACCCMVALALALIWRHELLPAASAVLRGTW